MAKALGEKEARASRLDFPGFAQEFLRRNLAYCRDYDSVMSNPYADTAAQEVMARRWGLNFPARSAPASCRSARPLVGHPMSLCRHPRGSATRVCGRNAV